MKKITFYFLFLISMLQIHAQSNVTFSVDMSGQTGFTTVYVSGSLNGWSGDANPLTDTDGDGVWETTLSIADGSYEYKFTLDNWTGQENLSQGLVGTTTNDCDGGALCTNRTLTVSGADKVLDTVPFQGTNINAGPYSVTFNVDMSSYTGTFGSVNINGENYNNQGLGGWCGGCNTLTDDDGDNIYSATIQLEAYTYSFKFTVDGWTDQEMFSSGDAGTQTAGGNVNRLISVDNDMIVSAVWDDPASLSVTSAEPALSPEGTWYLSPVAGALAVGPNQGDGSWYSNSAADVTTRSCLFDDQFVFNADGSFQNVQGSETWLETWQGVTAESCGAPVSPHDGSNAATWAYDETANTITITGEGAHLGLAKAINGDELDGTVAVPASVTYTVSSLTETAMTIDINVGNGWWRFLFTTDAPVVETGPETSAPTPTADASDVVSIYSDTYTDVTYLASPTFAGGVLSTYDVSASDETLKLEGPGGAGFQFNYNAVDGIDLSSFTHFHMDYYIEGSLSAGEVLKSIIQNYDSSTGAFQHNIEYQEFPSTTGAWVSIDAVISDYDGGLSRDNIAQIMFLMAGPAYGPVFLDNIYFYREATQGLDDNVFNTVKMFPNPAKDTVQFSVNSNENLDIEIFDMLGKSVLRVNDVQNEVNISDLNSGLYFVQMTLGAQQATKKLIVN